MQACSGGLPSDKVLLVPPDGVQDEALIGFWDIGLCVALLVGEVHLTHDGRVVLPRLLHHLYTTHIQAQAS